MAEYFPDLGFVSIEFHSKLFGDWHRVRGTFGLMPKEAERRLDELKAEHPEIEYRIH